jgi:hypothetical protein
MKEKNTWLCPECGGDLPPGILFCWRRTDHGAEAPRVRVGTLRDDEGQLLWAATERAAIKLEWPLAVTVRGAQMVVLNVEEKLSAQPARLDLTLRDARGKDAESLDATVTIAGVLDAILAGREEIEATPEPV